MSNGVKVKKNDFGYYDLSYKGYSGLVEKSGGGSWYVGALRGGLNDLLPTKAEAVAEFKKWIDETEAKRAEAASYLY